MKKQNKKKPTMKEVEKVVGSLIMENQKLKQQVIITQQVLNNYVEFKKDTENFTKYVEDKNERGNKKDSDIIIAKK